MIVDETGVTKETFAQKMSDIIDAYNSLFPRVDLSLTSYLYQIAKVKALREMGWQETIGDLVYQLSPLTASGIWLDMFAMRMGLGRQGPKRASVYMWIHGVSIGTEITTLATFTAENDTVFMPSRNTRLPLVFDLVHASNVDDFPTNYRFVDVDMISADAGGLSPYEGWLITDDGIDWTGAASSPVVGTTIYVHPSDTVSVRVLCTATTEGSDGNVAVGSISQFTGVDAFTVENEVASAGGEDMESDLSLRERLVLHVTARNSRTDVAAKIDELEGIVGSTVSDVLAVDVAHPTNWDTKPSAAYASGWQTIEQDFSPSIGIGSINSISLSVSKLVDNPTPIKVSLLSNDDVVLRESWFDRATLSELQGSAFQEVRVPVRYAPVDATLTYTLQVEASGYAGARDWQVAFDGAGTGSGYVHVDGVGHDDNLAFKSWFKSNAVNVVVDVESGYSFADLETEVEALLESGNVFPGVDFAIAQATIVYLSFDIVVDTSLGYSTTVISDQVESTMALYIDTLGPGVTIYYSKLVALIMDISGVRSVRSMTIKKGTTIVSNKIDENDVVIAATETPRLGEVDITIGNIR